jgi:hypothetical protein
MSEVLFKNRQLCIYYETCDRRILGSSNLDPKSELCQNIQERVRLPWCAVALACPLCLFMIYVINQNFGHFLTRL